jgi:hypothetical protein
MTIKILILLSLFYIFNVCIIYILINYKISFNWFTQKKNLYKGTALKYQFISNKIN